MVDRVAGGEAVAQVAQQLRLSTTTIHRWWRRYRAEGPAGLQDRSSRPQRSPAATPRWRRRQIVRHRRQRWSSLQIAAALGLPLSTVVQVQRRLGWARLGPLVPKPPVHRYERRVPGALVHLDIKKLGRIGRVGHRIHGDRRTRVRGIGWEYLHIAIDDATRLSYAVLLPDETAASTAAFLHAAVRWFAQHGIRWRAQLTDNGGGYRSRRFRPCDASSGSATAGPGPTPRGPTGRPSGLFGPAWSAGRMPPRTPPRWREPGCCRSGSGITIRSARIRR